MQRRAYQWIRDSLAFSHIVILRGNPGSGKTTVLRELHKALGGKLVTIQDVVEAAAAGHPLALEDAFYQLALAALKAHDPVLIDDIHLLTGVVNRCGSYPRSGFLDAHMTALATYAIQANRKLVVAGDYGAPTPLWQRGYATSLGPLDVEDYRHLCRAYLLPETAQRLDYGEIHRFAPNLDARDLALSCAWLRATRPDLDTDRFIDYLRSQQLVSNVDIEEVDAVDLRELQGVDEVIESLEASVVLPLENDALARELALRPKRGVLLLGPPGTGKTTVGRALAHRLKGKFFRIDGTFVVGDFCYQVNRVFQAAMENAPSIVFVDDSDVIFEDGCGSSMYRYLLTMLDGLESESAGRVCVMMTAMDVGSLPPALIRSGRLELWLELRLPDEAARAAILRQQLSGAAEVFRAADAPRIAAATEGFTGADLKRLVDDGKVLFAHDRATGRIPQPATGYFLAAAQALRVNQQRYLEAAERARRQRLADAE